MARFPNEVALASANPISKPARRAWPWRALVGGCALGIGLAVVVEIVRLVATRNKHEVVPGLVYRSGQLTGAQLKRFASEKNIRTVVNLRGRPFADWYPEEAKVTQDLGISQEDVTTSANRLPSPGEIRRLVEVFDRSEHPILIHCQQGADRTGLASAMYLMLHAAGDYDYASARRQCSPRFGHLPLWTTVAMDEFFDQYEAWLAARGLPHSRDAFRDWATKHYAVPDHQADIRLVDPPTATEADRPTAFRLHVRNTGQTAWAMHAGSAVGVHAWYVVQNEAGRPVFTDRAGFFDRTVLPGESIELTLPVPPLPAPGRYRLYVDLSQRSVDFVKYGTEPVTHDWEARSPAVGRDK